MIFSFQKIVDFFTLHKLGSMLFGYVLFVVILASGQYVYFKFAPIETWVEYETIELAKKAKAGEPLEFYSFSAVHRSSGLEWNDSLHCDLEDGIGFRFVSRQKSSTGATDVRPMGKVAWTYNEPVPKVPATCYLRSVITVKPGYNIKKVGITYSDHFPVPIN